VIVVVFTSDRGLAGAFNTNIIKRTEAFIREELVGCEVSLRLIGKKANQYFSRRAYQIVSFDGAPVGAPRCSSPATTAHRAIDDFTSGKADRVFVIYNEFKSAITQTTVVKQVLPVVPEVVKGADKAALGQDYDYEPSKQELLTRLVPLYVQIGLYRAALESIAGEFGARMSAMESATKNAGEMINKLTLQYNRARQASITKELLEIIGGAEALKG
jgi:F-type H+-transporting ATPase subunit gamma